MKMPPLGLSTLTVPRLGLASFRRRLIVRATFVFLIAATIALAVVLLNEEKQRSYDNYEQGFRRTQAEIAAKLRHPSGQLALLNPASDGATTPLHPLVLPFGAIDFDDQNKARQAVEMAGCSVQYRDGSAVCVAVGNNLYSGAFIYLVGSFAAGELQSRPRGALDLNDVHRARVTLDMRGRTTRWTAPYEAMSERNAPVVRGRLTGFLDTGQRLVGNARPVRDFRGWLWQNRDCAGPTEGPDCPRRTFFSIRLPVETFREALFQVPRPAWPPKDLDQVRVRVEVLAPGSEAPLFDSDAPGATPPFSLAELSKTLLPGETLRIRKTGTKDAETIAIKGAEQGFDRSSPWLSRLIRRLPVENREGPVVAREVVATPVGSYDVELVGDMATAERNLSAVATRLSWYMLAMLVAIALAWLVIEIGLIRRIAVLTKRAAAVSYNVKHPEVDKRIGDLDVSDLRGSDELGILAGSLSTLLQRVKDFVAREHIRAQQERDMWHAVGHEIMSPLQSLIVLHGTPDDPSHRYVQRMQQAVRVLYGTASPSEAIEAAAITVGAIDLDEFLCTVASNAHFAGVDGVRYARAEKPVLARADGYSLEDVVTHILRNADRHRHAGTPITIALTVEAETVVVTIHNCGAGIDPGMLDKIFEYGVSESDDAASDEHRGQGLFVARTYMAKMGGTIAASNVEGGVRFALTLQRVR